MSCGSCAASIKRATKAIEGVRDVHVDLVGRRARVEYDDAIASLEKIRTAIEELGYKTGTPVVEGR
jgi:copper chaperone CopZ